MYESYIIHEGAVEQTTAAATETLQAANDATRQLSLTLSSCEYKTTEKTDWQISRTFRDAEVY
jgi:hypothetical protein